MIFQSKDFHIILSENKDIKEILEVYNSNEKFLINHMDTNKITSEWVLRELENMRAIGFCSYKIVDISMGKIIGFIDFKVDNETYLSLLMIHSDFQGRGIGKLIFQELEEYVKSLKSKCIRLDVVTNYDNSALKFWVNNGFVKSKDLKLNWSGKVLPAITMKKFL
ncbi:GNAT family N-acetyltransferase [Clostridium sp. D2Q-11]|uniref:GNAT family N-acetyltransferase n=1 Tax=Anaeromonas frigoriresistens TaxID=2683708 RepID=A0A942UWT4_9FIRM|nr:GNAT family N-acetyltransferase [Anaeromonas frigoriresistens]MBS4539005.1 GNAT family N-acetyltransferase [Anaeromonas frigoriresistens]